MRTLSRIGPLCLALSCVWGLAGCSEPPATVVPPKVSLTPEQHVRLRAVFASADPDEVKAALAEVAAALPAIPWLLEGLLHPNRGVREWSAHALGDLAPQDDGVVRALVLSFEDNDDYVRWKAARALGNIGPRAVLALPLLRMSADAETEVEVVRAASQKAVGQINDD